jgi:hypothetical protein
VHVHIFGNRIRVRVTYICRLGEQAYMYKDISYIYMIAVVSLDQSALRLTNKKVSVTDLVPCVSHWKAVSPLRHHAALLPCGDEAALHFTYIE